MSIAVRILVDIFGVTTMCLLLYSSAAIIMGDSFGLLETTFLMFASFVLTTLFG